MQSLVVVSHCRSQAIVHNYLNAMSSYLLMFEDLKLTTEILHSNCLIIINFLRQSFTIINFDLKKCMQSAGDTMIAYK